MVIFGDLINVLVWCLSTMSCYSQQG